MDDLAAGQGETPSALEPVSNEELDRLADEVVGPLRWRRLNERERTLR